MTVLDSYMRTGENAKTRLMLNTDKGRSPLDSRIFTEKLPSTLSTRSTDSPHTTFSTLSHFTSGSGASGNRKGWDTERHGAQ